MYSNSNAVATIGFAFSVPLIAISASFSPVAFCAAAMRSRYFFESRNFKRIGRLERREQFFAAAFVEERVESRARAHRMMVRAFRADHEVALELGAIQHRAAALAFFPEAFGHLALRRRRRSARAATSISAASSCRKLLLIRSAAQARRLPVVRASSGGGLCDMARRARVERSADRRDETRVHARTRPAASLLAASRSTSALPITTASANAPIAAAEVASRTPKPTATGVFAERLMPATRAWTSSMLSRSAPVMPAKDT